MIIESENKKEIKKNWGDIYGQATGQISNLIDKQSKVID